MAPKASAANAAADGDHRAIVLGDEIFQAASLEATKPWLTIEHEDFVEAHAGFGLDRAVEFDEGYGEFRRQGPAQRRLAGPAQADQRDPPAP